MNFIKKYKSLILGVAVSVFLVGGLVTPAPVKAQTIAELQAQIQALMQQIAILMAQQEGGGSGPTSCILTRDLTVGSAGSDVRVLEKFLNRKGYTVSVDTLFNANTRDALARYQAANGINPASGYFGPITRANINSQLILDDCRTLSDVFKLTSPNGGEVWQLNSVHSITWQPDSQNINVVAYLEQKVGNDFREIGRIVPIGKGSILWDGEIDRSGNYADPGRYYIRLENSETGESDRSDNSFRLINANEAIGTKITLINGKRPNETYNNHQAASVLDGDSQVSISWSNTGIVESCSIVIYNSNTTRGSVNLTNRPSSGTERVTLPPGNVGERYIARVSCYGPGGVSDRNTGEDYLYLTIIGDDENISIRVMSPNGGEAYKSHDGVPFSWDWSGATHPSNPVAYIVGATNTNRHYYGKMLEYDSQSSVQRDELSNGVCSESEPCVPDLRIGGQYLVKVCEFPPNTSAGNPQCDVSDLPFTITASEDTSMDVTVTTPNGGEEWEEDSIQTIRWQSENLPSSASISISLFRADGANTQIVSGLSATAESYRWTVSTDGNWGLGSRSLFEKIASSLGVPVANAAAPAYKIQVGVNDGSGVNYRHASDSSDDYFLIVPQEESEPEITEPTIDRVEINNYQTPWTNRTAKTIRWNYSNLPQTGLKFKVGLYTNLNGGMWGNSVFVNAVGTSGAAVTSLDPRIGESYFNKDYFIMVRLYNADGTEFRPQGKRIETVGTQIFQVVPPTTGMVNKEDQLASIYNTLENMLEGLLK